MNEDDAVDLVERASLERLRDLDTELLSGLSSRDLSFLTRTSVLDRLSGPLCDAVLQELAIGIHQRPGIVDGKQCYCPAAVS